VTKEVLTNECLEAVLCHSHGGNRLPILEAKE